MGAAAAGAAAAAAVANAVKAAGTLIRLEPEEFRKIVCRSEAPLVVVAQGGIFRTYYQYLSAYKGLTFYCKAKEPVALPAGAEIVTAKEIWIPGT